MRCEGILVTLLGRDVCPFIIELPSSISDYLTVFPWVEGEIVFLHYPVTWLGFEPGRFDTGRSREKISCLFLGKCSNFLYMNTILYMKSVINVN